MIKSWREMAALDLTAYITNKPDLTRDESKRNRDGFDYLSWADALQLLYENGAERVNFEPILNSEGISWFWSQTKGVPEVRIKLEVDDKSIIYTYPMIRGIRVIAEPTALDAHMCIERAFVKAAAILTGLGISLWIKSDEFVKRDFEREGFKDNIRELLQTLQKQAKLKDVSMYELLKTSREEIQRVVEEGEFIDLAKLMNDIQLAIIESVPEETDAQAPTTKRTKKAKETVDDSAK